MSRAHSHGPHHSNHHHHEHSHPPRRVQEQAHSPGHNGPRPALQWQTLHEAAPPPPRHEHDLDLVEASFVEGFGRASDVTSFLRLAGIPFVGRDETGKELRLLRVQIDDVTDVASLTPLLGAVGLRYDPLPARFTSRRRKLTFCYFDGAVVVALDFSAARALADVTSG